MRNVKATSGIASPTCLTNVVASFLLGTFAIPVGAANFSFTGTFSYQNQLQPFEFSIGGRRVVSINTLSSVGGTNAAGNEIPEGGFDPIVSLFTLSGQLLDFNDDHFRDDSFVVRFLAPGTYQVTLTAYALSPRGRTRADGFCCFGFGTGRWALDIMNVDSASQLPSSVIVPTIPEPETYALLLAGLGLVGLAAARRNKRQ